MTGKTNGIKRTIVTCFVGLILVSCESHEQKTDDAFEKVKEEKFNSKSTITQPGGIIEVQKKAVLVKKVEAPDEWTRFRQETELKIELNESRIISIKRIPWVSLKIQRKVMFLEKDNNDLRLQMKEYKEEVEDNWKKFRAKTNLKVNDIAIELKDLEINR